MIQLYKNIRILRKKNNWTQEDLASRMGYTDRSMIAKIESGIVDLPQSKIMEFAKVFGVNSGDLMGDDGTSSIEDTQSVRNKEFIELFENTAPVVQESVVNILKSAQQKP